MSWNRIKVLIATLFTVGSFISALNLVLSYHHRSEVLDGTLELALFTGAKLPWSTIFAVFSGGSVILGTQVTCLYRSIYSDSWFLWLLPNLTNICISQIPRLYFHDCNLYH
jgi:hypothetical protein